MEEDRISDLPEHIKHQILCHIPTIEAIATSVLSRAWRGTWFTLPSLYFDEKLFSKVLKKKLKLVDKKEKKKIRNQIIAGIRKETAESFMCFVDQTLKRRRQVHMEHVPSLVLYLPPCLTLDDKNTSLRSIIDFNFPTENLEIICGGSVNYELSNKHFKFSCFQSPMRSLSLDEIKLDQNFFQLLAANCPLLVELNLYNCPIASSTKTVRVSGLPKLSYLTAWFVGDSYEELSVDAPRLVYPWQKNYDSQCEIYISNCWKLKHVDIYNATFINSNHLNQLPNLEHLSLDSCHFIKENKISISSNRLKSLKLSSCCESHVEVEIDAPNLEGFWYSDLEDKSIKSLKLNAPNLKHFSYAGECPFKCKFSEFKLQEAYVDIQGGWMLAMFVKFLEKLNHPHSLQISLGTKHMINLRTLKNADNLPILYDVKNLKVNLGLYSLDSRPTESEIIEALLWVCPHPETISLSLCILCATPRMLHMKFQVLKVLKFKYKEKDDGVEACYRCSHLPVRCWQHCLREVEIESDEKLVIDGDEKLQRMVPDRYKSLPYDASIEAFFANSANDIVVKINGQKARRSYASRTRYPRPLHPLELSWYSWMYYY